jgi:hypothetical protein
MRMAQRHNAVAARRERLLVNGLWVTAAIIVLAGFAMRVLASLVNHPSLRLIGVVVIACGLVVAVVGWLSERLIAKRVP